MNLIQQLAEYQNAPLQTLEAAKKGANPNVSPWVAGAILSDRIEKQKRMQTAQGAAQGPQPTVDEQQDQEVAGIMQALSPQGAPQAQPAQQAEPVMAADGGLLQAKVDPRMFDYSGGGIIAFSGKNRSDVPEADDTIYDPVTGVPIAGASTREGEDMTLREALGLGNVENRRALERAEKERTAPKKLSLAEQYEKAQREGNAAGATPYVPPPMRERPPAAPAAPAKPAGSGAGIMGAVQKAVTGSPEWATMEAARTKAFEAPDMPTTAGGLAEERAAHLKAQGITERPWETSNKQTAELRRIMAEEDAARKKDIAENERNRRYDTFVANLGSGSFGQSGQGGLRALVKRDEDMRAEEQRIKERRYEQNLKLNEIDRKAQELQYNEATGDVAAAQKNREELAKLKREYRKDQAGIAKDQATLRQYAAAHDAQNATTLAAARERAAQGGNAETKLAIQALKTQKDSINARFAKDPLYKRTPQGKADAAELLRIEAQLAQIAGLDSTMPVGGGPKLSASDQALINKYLPKK